MQRFIKSYHKGFINLLNSIKITDRHGKKLDFYQSVEIVSNIIKQQASIGGRIFLIGNGGSAAIASHAAIDFWKNARIQAMAFNDSSLLTCVSNDFGYDYVFKKPIEFFTKRNDLLFAISSSGKSKNILEGVRSAQLKGCVIITFSGFDKSNPLRSMGTYNFYVPSHEYGFVEVTHQYICHCIVDTLIEKIK